MMTCVVGGSAQAPRRAAVARGVSSMISSYVDHAARRHADRCGRSRVDRLRLGHRGHQRRQRRPAGGRGGPGPGRAVHPHLLHGRAVRVLCGRLRAAQRADAGRPRQALGAVQLGRRGGRERGEDRPARDRAAGGRGVRPRLPRPDQPDDGADREEHAVQAPVRAVRRRDLPGADVLPAARRRAVRREAAAARRWTWSRSRSARTTWPPCSSSRSRARAASSCRRPGFLPALAAWAPAHGALFIADEIQTGFCRTGDWFASEHEARRARPGHHGQGHRRRPAAGRRHRPGRDHGRGARRRARRHLRRQPDRLRRRAGRHRDDARARPVRAPPGASSR